VKRFGKCRRKSKLNTGSEKIGKIWKKGKLNSEKIWISSYLKSIEQCFQLSETSISGYAISFM
jgi:hypothetical protein